MPHCAARSGDVLAMTYAARPEALKRANDCLALARDARARGKFRIAKALEGQARGIIDDPTSYRPAKLALVQTDVQNRTNVPIDLPFVSREHYATGKFEHPAIVLSLA